MMMTTTDREVGLGHCHTALDPTNMATCGHN